jgi:biotin carboxylase
MSEMSAVPRPRLLLLTGGPHQLPIIRRAKMMGVETVVTDRRSDAPAFAEADYPVVADANDCQRLVNLARSYQVSGVMAEQTDVAVTTGAFVAAELGLPAVSREAATRATNKLAMREACRAAGIPTPAYRYVKDSNEAWAAAVAIGLPVVVKPVDSQSSRGVSKIEDLHQVPQAFDRAKAVSRADGVLVEEMMTGVEGSIESFVNDGQVNVISYCDKIKCAPPFSYDLQLIYPGDFSPSVVEDLKEMNVSVIAAVGIRLGFVHAEFIVTSKGVRLIEIAARGCGARVVTDLLPAALGIDLIGPRIRQAIGRPVLWPDAALHRYGILRFIELPPGRIIRMGGLKESQALKDVVLVHLPLIEGQVINQPEDASGRPGFIQAVGDSREGVIAAANCAIAALDVEVRLSDVTDRMVEIAEKG